MPRLTLSLPSSTAVLDTCPNPRKIAIVGSGASSLDAPFKDDSWAIWAFSRRQFNSLPRFDKWFELHNERLCQGYEMRAPELKGYMDFLQGDNVILQKDFPKDALIEEFGSWFFESGQAPWIMAYALTQNPEAIGLWGIDAIGPHKPQRKDLQYFCAIAKWRGVKIVVPEGCTLLEPAEVYAFR